MTIDEVENIPMLFIVGVGRSGTTLLRTIMDASSEAIFPPESKIIIHLKQKYFRRTAWNEKVIDEFLTDLYKETKFATVWKVEKEELRSFILSFPTDKLTFQLIIKMIYLSFPSNFEKNKIKLIGDKNPAYSLFIEELIEVFPRAKFIHLVRDYRDTIASQKKIFIRKDVASLSMVWKVYSWLIEKSKSIHPQKFYTIRYCDLVENSEIKVEQIFQYSHIKYDKKVLRYYENLEEEIDEEHFPLVKEIHPNLFNEINTDSLGKWQNELTHEELEIITYFLGKYGELYDYKAYHKYDGKKFRWKKFVSTLTCITDIVVTKGYFLLPFKLRDIFTRISQFLFTKFGYYNVYNSGDFILEAKNDDNPTE